MNINHHNYEEYFILYLDNELSSEDRRMVETFVQHNPDLKEELDVLLQSRLIPDSSIVFEGKDELIKMAEVPGIDMTNYEEWLVLYMDNELSAGQKTAVEEFVAKHPVAKAELELFNKTKLQPEEEIVFPGKESLYKRTEKVRVIPVRWWRLAAAAVLILIAGISTVVILNNRKPSVPGKDVATNPNIKQKTNTENPVLNNKETNHQTIQTPITDKNNPAIVKTVKQNSGTVVPKHNNIAANDKAPNNLPKEMNKKDEVIANNNEDPSNKLPQPTHNPYANNKTSDPIAAENIDPEKNIKNIQSSIDSVTNPTVKPYSNKIASANPTENPDATYASFEEGNNKKTRGLFRKAVRLFTKTTKINPADDDDRVMIGGLAVKLK